MKTKHLVILFIGLILGFLISEARSKNNSEYFTLQEDCEIAGFGSLNKGVKLKYLESTSEGLTRYILYLNTKGVVLEPYKSDKENLVIPYLLISKPNTSNKDTGEIKSSRL